MDPPLGGSRVSPFEGTICPLPSPVVPRHEGAGGSGGRENRA